jgi:hypothetical protein
MKHILNNISEEEKNAIREQHTGGMKLNTEKFKNLIETKQGDVKPILKEQTEGINFTVKKYPNKKYFVMVTSPTITSPTDVGNAFPGVAFVGYPSVEGFNSEQEANTFIETIKKLNLVSKKQIDMKNIQLFSNPEETEKSKMIMTVLSGLYKNRLEFLGVSSDGTEKPMYLYICGKDYIEDKLTKDKFYNKKFVEFLKNYILCDSSGAMTPPKADF